MKHLVKQYLSKLTQLERDELDAHIKEQGLTLDEWFDFFVKAQLYRNAEEVLLGESAA